MSTDRRLGSTPRSPQYPGPARRLGRTDIKPGEVPTENLDTLYPVGSITVPAEAVYAPDGRHAIGFAADGQIVFGPVPEGEDLPDVSGIDDPNGWLREDRTLDAHLWRVTRHTDEPDCPNQGVYWAVRQSTTTGLVRLGIGACVVCYEEPEILSPPLPMLDREDVEAAIVDHHREENPEWDDASLLPIVWVNA